LIPTNPVIVGSFTFGLDLNTSSRSPDVTEPRKASGLRAIHRRFR
jgi:hypothetical protein